MFLLKREVTSNKSSEPFFFYILVPSCRLPVPKVQGWFTASNPNAENERGTSPNKHGLLWPPENTSAWTLGGTFCHFHFSLELHWEWMRQGGGEENFKRERKQEMSNSLGMWCRDRTLGRKCREAPQLLCPAPPLAGAQPGQNIPVQSEQQNLRLWNWER